MWLFELFLIYTRTFGLLIMTGGGLCAALGWWILRGMYCRREGPRDAALLMTLAIVAAGSIAMWFGFAIFVSN